MISRRAFRFAARSTIQKGIDATDKQGHTYQIKSRIVSSLTASTSFDFSTLATKFDWLVCIFFLPTLELWGIVRVPYEVVRDLGVQNNPTDFRFRWNKRVSKDRRIEKFYWKEAEDNLRAPEVE